MSIRAAQRLRKLTDWHRQGAYLIANGLMYIEVSNEIGGHPFHWGRLVNYSELFQSYLYVCRDQVEEEYRGRLINTFGEKIRRRRQRQQQRARKSSSPQSAGSPSAAPTPPGQKDDMISGGSPQLETGVLRRPDVSAPQLQPQSPMSAGQVPPPRQSWQNLIAKRQKETRYAWQAADGTATGGRPR